jgi:transketolase
VDYGKCVPDAMLISTGSELDPRGKAADQLKDLGILTRVVSEPSSEISLESKTRIIANRSFPQAAPDASLWRPRAPSVGRNSPIWMVT